LKVLLVNSEEGLRGGEIQTLLLARGLKSRGCEVKLALKGGSTLAGIARDGLDCHEFAFESPPFFTPVKLANIISEWRPDIVHAQSSRAHSHVLLARFQLHGRKFIFVVSRRTAFRVSSSISAYFKYRKGVDHFIPISEAAAETLRSIGIEEERITVIPSGIEIERFRRVAEDREGSKGGVETVIGCIGSLEREKGHSCLIDAAGKVLAVRSDVRFVIYGKGRLEGALKAQVKKLGIAGKFEINTFMGPMEKVLSSFDIFVLPSLEEGLSTALMAALACGLPVVASRTGGVPEVVRENAGLLVPPGDSDALAEALLKLLRDEKLRTRFSEAAFQAAQRFDIRVTVEETYNLYRNLVEKYGNNL